MVVSRLFDGISKNCWIAFNKISSFKSTISFLWYVLMTKLSSSEVDFWISLICVNVLSLIIFSDVLETFSISFD
ncbi:hypothetical protein V2P32_00445 [Mycoplasma sp. 06067-C1-B144P-99-0482-3]|uniref:hypothetical protein n=1 Tax=Mycoplasma sp. 06067-C1-B144P-99-0482-3 TaxID=3117438 RepID=UPI003DA20416